MAKGIFVVQQAGDFKMETKKEMIQALIEGKELEADGGLSVMSFYGYNFNVSKGGMKVNIDINRTNCKLWSIKKSRVKYTLYRHFYTFNGMVKHQDTIGTWAEVDDKQVQRTHIKTTILEAFEV